MKDDTISRQAAITLFEKYGAEEDAIALLNSLPPSQLAQDLPNGCTDTISRAAAIDAFAPYAEYESNRTNAEWVRRINMVLSALPPAQPEPEEFEWCHTCREYDQEKHCCHRWTKVIRKTVDDMKATQPGWIPVTERLPEDAYPVIVTWKNDDPKSYYQYILGKHYTGVAHFKNGIWYWYSSTTEDVLMEYGRCDSEEFDEAIQVLAWQPLPKPWEGEKL